MEIRKKSQGGTNAAILITLITILIIIYIIFLPESEKRAIFEGNDTSKVKSGAEKTKLLLREFPGTISAVSGVEEEKTLPNIFLLEAKNAKELVRINPFIVSSTSFSQKIRTEQFSIAEFENVDNAVLTFDATAMEGILTIKFNNRIIFENEIKRAVEPIRINKNDLSKDNVIEFSVDKPGIAFWKTNKYSLDNIRIIGDISDRTLQESRNLFILRDEEFNNVERAELKFVPYCSSVRDVGHLDILVNSREIFSAIPVCDDPYKQIIPTGVLRKGENSVIFRTNKGSYSVEQIVVGLDFREARTPPHFFELTEGEFDDINQSRKGLLLTLSFVDDKKIRDLVLDINGFKRSIDTKDNVYTRTISANLTKEGNNFIRLIPEKDDIDVVELKVELVKK